MVELAGRHTRGQTTVDRSDLGGEAPNVEVVLEVDGDRFWEMLRASVGLRVTARRPSVLEGPSPGCP